MAQTHRDEIIRWANAEKGTQVWYKYNTNNWSIVQKPVWADDVEYVVDDEWAEIAKQFIDDPSKVEYHSPYRYAWVTTEHTDIHDLRKDCVDDYRIKPKETVYEYQYIYYCYDENRYKITVNYYTSVEEICLQNVQGHTLERYDISARIKKWQEMKH